MLGQLMTLMCNAIALNGAGQTAQAIAELDQALALDAGFLPVHMQRAALLLQAGDAVAAVQAYQACLDIAPCFDDARQAHHTALLALTQQCEAALANGVATAQTYRQLACARLALDQPLPALASIEQLLASNPTDFSGCALRADILLRLNRHEDALASYQGLVDGDIDAEQQALIAYNRATILRQMARYDDALAQFNTALAWRPSLTQARVGRAHMQLLRGDFAAGWHEHEARHDIVELARTRPRSEQPQWLPGQDVSRLHVLLWAEQGQGDALQFARYIGLVATRAARTTVCCVPAMASLLAMAFPSCDFVSDDKHLPPHDVIASLLSLPLLLGLPDPQAAPMPPYLHADPARSSHWRVPPARRPRIGIAWAGRQYATIHHTRDIPLAELLPLFELPVDFVALQPVIPATDAEALAAIDSGQQAGRLQRVPLADWADTAALVAELDAVISVDSAVAHLAGAMARPVWVLLRFEGEWRWGQDPQASAWYPGMQLVRQQVRGRWDEPVRRVRQACAAMLATQ
ncbi:tetratricopeptide repeat protein [Herbaspirillum sp. alder98]|uniref:tetratricopeptide repeat protein n=1 Tax=Herbaspirillum sp. alder98 TaxID=2913096 RepID=UPI001CD8DB24|nr:tetratricopeptide repeat protein [Herbaspirillum sp. alder98]MCA1323546.1 tetratricopeptide repeat protein [Herbaspirillum sp. alder98]